jgi:hypothetical protein
MKLKTLRKTEVKPGILKNIREILYMKSDGKCDEIPVELDDFILGSGYSICNQGTK